MSRSGGLGSRNKSMQNTNLCCTVLYCVVLYCTCLCRQGCSQNRQARGRNHQDDWYSVNREGLRWLLYVLSVLPVSDWTTQHCKSGLAGHAVHLLAQYWLQAVVGSGGAWSVRLFAHPRARWGCAHGRGRLALGLITGRWCTQYWTNPTFADARRAG